MTSLRTPTNKTAKFSFGLLLALALGPFQALALDSVEEAYLADLTRSIRNLREVEVHARQLRYVMMMNSCIGAKSSPALQENFHTAMDAKRDIDAFLVKKLNRYRAGTGVAQEVLDDPAVRAAVAEADALRQLELPNDDACEDLRSRQWIPDLSALMSPIPPPSSSYSPEGDLRSGASPSQSNGAAGSVFGID